MDTKTYRRQIERSVAAAQAASSKIRRAPGPNPRVALADKKAAVKTRAAALGRLMRAERPEEVPQAALDVLADSTQPAQLRIAALRLLQLKAFVSPTYAEWRPQFIQALRKAVDGPPALREAALEVLAHLKDRPTQERLLEGLRQPRRALVPAHDALRLLSGDIHADVIDVARKLMRSPQAASNEAVALQATRILSADPGSVGTLEKVMGSSAHAMDVRRAAATGLSNLAPEKLDSAKETAPAPSAARRRGKAGKKKAGKKKAGPTVRRALKPQGALAQHIATLQKVGK